MDNSLSAPPVIVVIAGPNGAGKSTFYEAHYKKEPLFSWLPFINADVIAKDERIDAYAAANEAELKRAHFVRFRQSFIFETVLSDPVGDKVAFLKRAASDGYDVTMIYIGIPSWEFSDRRVYQRTLQGGHDVPTDKIKSRYERSLKNLARAIGELQHLHVFDNSGTRHRLIARYEDGVQSYLTSDIPEWFAKVLKKVAKTKR